MKNALTTLMLFSASLCASAQISITIDTDLDNREVSPYLIGRNGAPTSSEYSKVREAGIQLERMNDGNNCTKYNWRKKITSHPDWYNNVYDCNWDNRAKNFQRELPNVKGLFAFQLLGKVAKTKDNNFDDWNYNGSDWWNGCTQNACGGGEFNESGKLVVEGNPDLYLEDWPADSTVAIYKHWEEDLQLDMSQFDIWNMDNEMEIWTATHDDVYKKFTDETYDEIMQKYFAVAKAIRKINPDVKLAGPAAASEWTWFTPLNGEQPHYEGKQYCWLEYFIMRCAKEQKESGVRMLDILDLHNYPDDKTEATILQTHRMYYDKSFKYLKANGVKTVNGGWDNNQTSEYIFLRCQEWIDKYFGENSGIQFGVGEYGVNSSSTCMIHALAYASHLGEGSRNGMFYFCPWTWYNSMWEVANVFSHLTKKINVSAISSKENMVSAYTTKNAENDSLSIVLVNRSTEAQSTTIEIHHTAFCDGSYPTYTLRDLPETVTFNSQTDNALQPGSVNVNNNTLQITLPAYSITTIQLYDGATATDDVEAEQQSISIYPNPTNDWVNITSNEIIEKVEIINAQGIIFKEVEGNNSSALTLNVEDCISGTYIIKTYTKKGAKSSLLNVK